MSVETVRFRDVSNIDMPIFSPIDGRPDGLSVFQIEKTDGEIRSQEPVTFLLDEFQSEQPALAATPAVSQSSGGISSVSSSSVSLSPLSVSSSSVSSSSSSVSAVLVVLMAVVLTGVLGARLSAPDRRTVPVPAESGASSGVTVSTYASPAVPPLNVRVSARSVPPVKVKPDPVPSMVAMRRIGNKATPGSRTNRNSAPVPAVDARVPPAAANQMPLVQPAAVQATSAPPALEQPARVQAMGPQVTPAQAPPAVSPSVTTAGAIARPDPAPRAVPTAPKQDPEAGVRAALARYQQAVQSPRCCGGETSLAGCRSARAFKGICQPGVPVDRVR